jgi:hypothetical protein
VKLLIPARKKAASYGNTIKRFYYIIISPHESDVIKFYLILPPAAFQAGTYTYIAILNCLRNQDILSLNEDETLSSPS